MTVDRTPRFAMGNEGLVPHGEPSHQVWDAYGRTLFRMGNALNFVVGDWLVYGEERGWSDDSTYYDVAKAFSRSYEWVSQCVRVARQFPRRLRKPGLAWSVYRELLAAPESQRRGLLDRAADQDWTKDETIRQTGRTIPGSRQQHTPRPTKWGGRNVRCPKCGERFQIT